MLKRIILFVVSISIASQLAAELSVPAVFSDHMVLQRDQANKVWGWDEPDSNITVSFAGKKYKTKASDQGAWSVTLAPSEANAHPQTLSIKGTTKLDIQDVLVGEVWICSGQSNMRWSLKEEINGDLNALTADNDMIRLLRVPSLGIQEPQDTFEKQWERCNPETAATFSAVGFYYGRYLQEILDVPVGLIDNSWGGSAAEAWIRRDLFAQDPELASMETDWQEREAYLQSTAGEEAYQTKLAEWEVAKAEAESAGKWVPRKPQSPAQVLSGNKRLGNLYNGVLHPTIGYGIKGVIWYQGEANVGRADDYHSLFSLLIQSWRDEWGQGDFPFYWAQLADFQKEQPEPQESNWAILREAQTLTMSLPNTGQAVIIDLGEAKDIHPRNKYEVASRLVRWPLAKDYGHDLPYRSPEYRSHEIDGNKALVHFDCFGSSLKGVDSHHILGFSICGEDRVWHWADAEIVVGTSVSVSSDAVSAPIAVRYAWANNPVCNLYSSDDLPVTPFRTDNFPAK